MKFVVIQRYKTFRRNVIMVSRDAPLVFLDPTEFRLRSTPLDDALICCKYDITGIAD